MSNGRSLARQRAVQAVYQWLVAGGNVGDIERQFLTDPELEMDGVDRDYFGALLHGVPGSLTALQGHLDPLLDRPLSQVDPVERAILLLGAYELAERPEVPYRVVINEAVEQAKTFGAEQGHRYVNGVLDKLARSLRAEEAKGRRR